MFMFSEIQEDACQTDKSRCTKFSNSISAKQKHTPIMTRISRCNVNNIKGDKNK